ncbi:lysophospholipase L1-like esterase [Virgibacillus natechei]|uniref:Lysophospholipase L1-like esterase n=1 Tax=Virgibacillus natechei TaxID=1216297 RepID=A0ABS4IFV2_9BACI|nr:SGNH/GDSL hydrolase family protein [Virgibacillus natechei]MBP1969216.1 lysophospholipase L1-like esterase [Virgibacillus natechei]UZD12380.1 SGNH/GDSL hydrolase family protein [Virgibacillus natechei]
MPSKRILFIGDSITESGKRTDSEQIGTGYVRLIHDYLKTAYPHQSPEIVNNGISANRISDLASRWQADVIDWNPDVLTISIGINDVWRRLDEPKMEQIYPDKFGQIYEDLLAQVRDHTNAAIVLMEPTVIEEEANSIGNETLKEYVEVIHQMADKFDATIVRTHEAFINYLHADKGYKLTIDGVHMNSTGDMLMAATWLKAVKDIMGTE